MNLESMKKFHPSLGSNSKHQGSKYGKLARMNLESMKNSILALGAILNAKVICHITRQKIR